MKYPKIYLVLDNCFAIKRWVKPCEWMEIAKELGFRYVQASTDNEIDPLFSACGYMDDWFEEVGRLQKQTGMQVANFYTGYQTYRTVGLAHHDARNREKIMEGWIKNLIRRISGLGARGLGFSFFAIPHAVLQSPDQYRALMALVCEQMADIALFAHQNGGIQVSNEQMYAPHQPPFTIQAAGEFLQNIYRVHKKPSYITIDVGHMVGQRKFLMPSRQALLEAMEQGSQIWLGSDDAHRKFEEAAACGNAAKKDRLAEEILADIHKHDYLFANSEDSDPYRWLESLACYSPVIHMQQTNGVTSCHAPFTPETNQEGIIKGDKLLQAIKKSYELNEKPQQELTEDIYLSFELFFANTDSQKQIFTKLRQNVAYWRKFVPEDGVLLNELI